MFADTGTDIVVADTYQADGLRHISRKTIGIDALWQLIQRHKFECHGQILLDQLVHHALYLLLLLTARLVVEIETHLTLLTLDVGIIGTLTPKQTDHRLIQKMLRCMGWREFILIVLVENKIVCHKGIRI